jgi:hypothetical protein
VKKRFALVIGAARSGTTALFRHLGAHPQVVPCQVKEPRFFTDDRKWQLGLDWYRSLWDFHEPDDRIGLEASTDYAQHPSVPSPAERIAQVPAGFRFVYVLRDPLARIESQETRARAEGELGPELVQGLIARHIDASRYATQLDSYLRHFSRGDFLLIRFEDLVDAPVDTLRRVCRFLEIDPYYAFRTLAPQPGAAAPRAGDGWLGRLSGLARLRGRRSPVRAPRRVVLTAEQRAFVLAELRDDLARLESEWGFDLSRWRLEP